MKSFLLRPIVLLLLAVALLHLPFLLLMPFHIDDAIFLRLTGNIATRPLAPLQAPMIWEGRIWADMMSYSHPPLLYYFMFMLNKLGGRQAETVLHLGFLVFPLLWAAAMVRLLRMFGVSPFWGGLAAALSPLPFTLSHTLMMDVPTAALALTGVVFSLEGVRDDRPGRMLLGGAWLGAACLVSLSAIFCLVPVGLAALAGPRRFRNAFLTGLVPVVVVALWLLWVKLSTGRFVFGDMSRVVAVYHDVRENMQWAPRIMYNLCQLGSLMVFPLVLLTFRLKTLRGKAWLLGALAAGFWITFHFRGEGLFHQMAMALLACAGAILLMEGLWTCLKERSAQPEKVRGCWLALGGWAAALFPLTILVYPDGAARYQLWFLPPLLVLFLHSFLRVTAPAAPLASDADAPASGLHLARPLRWRVALLLAGQLALGLALSLADLDLARAYKSGVTRIMREYGGGRSTVWVASEWQVRHYVTAAGGRTLLRYDTRPRPGDYLVKPVLTAPTYETGYESADRADLVEVTSLRAGFPARILDHPSRCGFWSQFWGYMPIWPASRGGRLDELRVYRIRQTLPPDPEKEKQNFGMLKMTGAGEIPR